MSLFLKQLILASSVLLVMHSANAQQFNVLILSRTAGWHHDSIPAGVAAIQGLGKLHHFNVMWTEDAKRFMNDKELAKYQAVIFLQTTGDILDEQQQGAFERYIRAGGGYVGVHSASDTEYGWEWYTKLVGHMFIGHPAIQTAVVQVEERKFPGMERFAARALLTEEWYEFGPALSASLRYLLSVDESTYKPEKPVQERNGKAGFHPISWYQQYDNGRSFYTALGHLSATYSDPVFLHHLYGGIYWAATGRGITPE